MIRDHINVRTHETMFFVSNLNRFTRTSNKIPLIFHETMFSPTKTQYPDVDLLSTGDLANQHHYTPPTLLCNFLMIAPLNINVSYQIYAETTRGMWVEDKIVSVAPNHPKYLNNQAEFAKLDMWWLLESWSDPIYKQVLTFHVQNI